MYNFKLFLQNLYLILRLALLQYFTGYFFCSSPIKSSRTKQTGSIMSNFLILITMQTIHHINQPPSRNKTRKYLKTYTSHLPIILTDRTTGSPSLTKSDCRWLTILGGLSFSPGFNGTVVFGKAEKENNS